MAQETAVARYQRLAANNRRPNKRIRKAAWAEVTQLLGEGVARDHREIEGLRSTVAKQQTIAADRLYGAQKFGRDVTQPLIIPLYRGTPPSEPEHGFRLIYVDGMPMRLWFDGEWAVLSGALLRDLGSSGLRVALAQACLFQEQRRWAVTRQILKFRDALVNPSVPLS